MIKNIWLQNATAKVWQVLQKFLKHPLSFVILLAVTFLVIFVSQTPHLGFYLDDWTILYNYNQAGWSGLQHYAAYNSRPFVFWIWYLGFRLVGINSTMWQILSVGYRFLSVIAIWLFTRKLFPKQQFIVNLGVLLYAIYPVFRQQPVGLTFSFHWFCLILYALSIYFMLLAFEQPRRYFLWTILSLVLASLELFTQEYYVGLELLRPIYLWIAISGQNIDLKSKLKKVAMQALPYLELMAIYLAWRLVYMPTPGSDRNNPSLLFDLFHKPLSFLYDLSGMAVKDIVEGLFGVWYQTIDPLYLKVLPWANGISWVAAVCFAGLFFIFFYFTFQEDIKKNERIPVKNFFLFGVCAMLLGFAPSWAIRRPLFNTTSMYNDRFGLSAMLGLSFTLIAFLILISKNKKYLLLIASILFGLAAGWQVRNLNTYRWSWDKQRNFYWQLDWRVPNITPPTVFYGNGALAYSTGGASQSQALIEMYRQGQTANTNIALYFDSYSKRVNSLANGQLIQEQDFSAAPQQGLVYQFSPEKSRCLWIVTIQDQDNLYIEPQVKALLSYSDINRIKRTGPAGLNTDIFGPEPEHSWCYYFQKAQLMSQFGNWRGVTDNWKEAKSKAYHPRDGIEYWPYIEGFARQNDWTSAVDLTKQALSPKYEMQAFLCSHWETLTTELKAPEKWKKIKPIMGCP